MYINVLFYTDVRYSWTRGPKQLFYHFFEIIFIYNVTVYIQFNMHSANTNLDVRALYWEAPNTTMILCISCQDASLAF